MMEKYNVFYHKYADDIQLYVIFDPSVPGDRGRAIRRMEACDKEIRLWMASRWLNLNDDKTELAIFMSAHHQKTYGQCDITIGESTISPDSHVRNLGVEMDSHLSMSHQVSAICKSCNFHLYRLSSIRRYLTVEATRNAVQALITSRLDYCDSLLAAITSAQVNQLQKMQSSSPCNTHSTSHQY